MRMRARVKMGGAGQSDGEDGEALDSGGWEQRRRGVAMLVVLMRMLMMVMVLLIMVMPVLVLMLSARGDRCLVHAPTPTVD
jgi:hypothetical protein